ncbi:MAG: spermidine synthase, partial [Burkholderiales bacterium]
VYAANTVGAIAGVFAAVHIGLPVLGLKGLIAAGATVDIGLGLLLLWWTAKGDRLAAYATATGLAGILATLAFVELDPYKMASGVYRHGGLLAQDKGEILFHRDGKTATINLVKSPDRVSIRTNGKSDAALNLDARGVHAPDETTMVLAAALPLALHPQARTAANIGLGSGLTSHVLLASDTLQGLDTIEIESMIVEAARGFSPRNDNVYRDPRSRIYIEDAKTFFSTHNKRYDIIVSEPSNPWVSGVASLFTDEFYRHVKRHLKEQGLFVQWVQLYEISPVLVASIFKALARHFPDYVVFAPNDFDIVIVARDGASLPSLSAAVFAQPRLAKELERIEVRSVADMELHRIGNRKAVQPYFDKFAIPANSDFFPVLDLNAAKARFMGVDASDIVNLAMTPVPALEMLGGAAGRGSVTGAVLPWFRKAELTRSALDARAYLLGGGIEQLARVSPSVRSEAQLVRLLAIECVDPRSLIAVDSLYDVASALVPFLTRNELRVVWDKVRTAPCAARLGEPQRTWLALFEAVSDRNAERMARLAETLLRQDAAHKDFLLGAAITGYIALNERERAAALWKEFAGTMVSTPNNMLPDLLRGHLFSHFPEKPGIEAGAPSK